MKSNFSMLKPGSIPERYFLFFIVSRPAVGPKEAPMNWTLGSVSSGLKRSGSEVNHSRHPVRKLRVLGAIPPLSHTSLRLGA
jgi:hypothetical protein